MPQSQSPHRHRQKLACASASADRDQQHITHRAPNLKKSSSTTCASFQSFHTNHITYSHNHNDDTNANDDTNDDDDNHYIAASEDSNPIIWEDDAGTDLRHLFTRRDANANNSEDNNGAPQLLPTMTQQVDEMMLHMDDSDDSDNDCSDGINDTKGHAKSDADAGNNSNSNYTNYTPPAAAAATRSKKQKYKLVLLDSGDVPATISKVKRKRRRRSNATANNNNGGGGGGGLERADNDPSDIISSSENVIQDEAVTATAADNKMKLSTNAKQEVDRGRICREGLHDVNTDYMETTGGPSQPQQQQQPQYCTPAAPADCTLPATARKRKMVLLTM